MPRRIIIAAFVLALLVTPAAWKWSTHAHRIAGWTWDDTGAEL